MKSFRLKIIITILAFSLGIASVYAIGGFSYLASQFERKTVVSEISTQTNEVLSEAISSKKESVNIHKLTYPFKDYPVTKIYKGKVAPLKLTRKEKEGIFGENYSTRLIIFQKLISPDITLLQLGIAECGVIGVPLLMLKREKFIQEM